MTHKEKAIELFFKYRNLENKDSFINNYNAKKCALIAVDEMIIQNGELYLNGLNNDYYKAKNAFLFEVKQEIEKL